MDDADMFDFDDLDPDEREQAAEAFRLNAQLDDEQETSARIEHEDPVGAVWFGEYPRAADADEWWSRRGL
jgi:hypothetical protein